MEREYVIFPMETINITTRANSGTHLGYQAWDLAGKDDLIEDVYAPFTCKVLSTYPYEESSGKINDGHTFIVGSCDESGNEKAVRCEDGVDRVLSFAITHDNDISDLTEGQIIRSGDILCQEGNAGFARGNHVHIEPAEGWQFKKHLFTNENDETYYVIDNNCAIGSLFFRLNNYTKDKNLNGYTFTTVDARSFEYTVDPATVFKLKANQLTFRIRAVAVSGTSIVTVPIGGEADIIEFLGKQSDGYQWVRVRYNNIEGYSQIDTYNAYLVTGFPSESPQNLYLKANQLTFRVRQAPVSGTTKVIVPVGSRAKIISLTTKQSDGYEWAYVNYNGQTGYSQIDTHNAYLLEF